MQSRQSLELRQHQHLALTPALQQSIRFLQLSAQDLEQEIAQALLENPLLEREEEYDTEAAGAEPVVADNETDDFPLWDFTNPRPGSDDDVGRPEASPAQTLGEYLLAQLRLTRASERDRALVSVLIDELDENGYLTTPLEAIASFLAPELDIELDEWRTALRLLQSFDPPGVGAVSLSQCLLLQLDQRTSNIEPTVLNYAREMARSHLDLLASGRVAQLREALGCSQDTLRAAHALLLGLNPKPGRAWASSTADYVIPEILVRKVSGRWKPTLNPAVMPRLRVNALYEHLLAQPGQTMQPPYKAAVTEPAIRLSEIHPLADTGIDNATKPEPTLQSHVAQAHGLIKSVKQRFDTVLRVAQFIVEHQQAFFEQGEQAMRPLLLRDIAQELQLHESTVSRATRQKYAQTPWGVIELKRFFSTALATDDGVDTSAMAVRSLIIKLIDAESASKPLSDSKIADQLARSGVIIARRTVAKYREAAGIEAASVRKARASLQQD